MRLTMDQKRGVTGRLAAKYRGCRSRKERTRILDEMVELTGYHRKYAIHLLRNYGKRRHVRLAGGELRLLILGRKNRRKRADRPRKYGEAVRQELVFLWDCFGLCGKRLKEAIRDLLPSLLKLGHFEKDGETHQALLAVSASTIDRLLAPERAKRLPKGISHTKPLSLLKAGIPIVVSSELNTVDPGHYQIDLVGHDGGNPNGQFGFSLNAVELSSGWIELRVVLNKAHSWTKKALQDIKANAPVPVLSLHSDNDSSFLNEPLQSWCADESIQYLRGRPYHSNDTCYIEQKNYNIVRQAVGYFRYETEEEIALIEALYFYLRPLVNFFFPSSRLLEKVRDGSRIRRRYDKPQSPYRRLLANERVDAALKTRLRHLKSQLDPFQLRANVSALQDQLIALQKKKGGAILFPGPSYPQAGEILERRLHG